MNFIAKPHQEVMIHWIKEHKRCAVFASMGSGKTVCSLTALEHLNIHKSVYPILIIAPLRVAKTTWPNEVSKWSHLSHLKTSVIVGSPSDRKNALKASNDVYTINYENLPWLIDELGPKWPFKTVIVDESTKLKGFRLRQGSKRAKALAKVAHTLIDQIILLTGTPAPNGLLDLWGQIWFIDKGKRLGKSFSAFTDRWFDEDYMGYNLTPKAFAQEQIQNEIKDTCLTIKTEDWMSIDQPVSVKVKVTLPRKANILYKQMEKEMFVQLKEEGIEALSAATVGIKCSQIANGALYLEDKTWEVLHDEKIAALQSIIEEANGMPVLVSYRFKSDLARLRSAFPNGKNLGDSDSIISDWNKGRIPILFIHPAAGSHGLNLQDGSNILAFFSINWNLEEHLQVIERIGPMRQKQSGHNRSVYLYYILAEGTIDETIMERLETKKSVQEVLLNAMKKANKREELCT